MSKRKARHIEGFWTVEEVGRRVGMDKRSMYYYVHFRPWNFPVAKKIEKTMYFKCQKIEHWLRSLKAIYHARRFGKLVVKGAIE